MLKSERKHSGADLARYIGEFMNKTKTDSEVARELGRSQTYVSKLRRISDDAKLLADWLKHPTVPVSVVYSLVNKSRGVQKHEFDTALNRAPPDRTYSRKKKAQGAPIRQTPPTSVRLEARLETAVALAPKDFALLEILHQKAGGTRSELLGRAIRELAATEGVTRHFRRKD